MSSTKAPEKIYGWLNTQLSIARYYGGCNYNGHSYLIDMQDPEEPLVRKDVLNAQLKARKAAVKVAKPQKLQQVTVLDLFEGLE